MRADQLLVSTGLAPSRTVAQKWIAAGRVQWRHALPPAQWCRLDKASAELPDDACFEIGDDPTADRYVSRGGLKLEGALAAGGLDVRDLQCLDLGLSTGGFADCLLQAGAARVVGIEVGHGQLHARLVPLLGTRLLQFEKTNARTLTTAQLGDAMPEAGFDLAVADLSFISLTLVLPAVPPLLRAGGRLLALVKPQFEVGRGGLGKGGIVRDASRYPQVEARIREACTAAGLMVRGYFDSPIVGGDGNREFFVHAEKTAESADGGSSGG